MRFRHNECYRVVGAEYRLETGRCRQPVVFFFSLSVCSAYAVHYAHKRRRCCKRLLSAKYDLVPTDEIK